MCSAEKDEQNVDKNTKIILQRFVHTKNDYLVGFFISSKKIDKQKSSKLAQREINKKEIPKMITGRLI